jgi:hypothetical protein
MVAARQGQRDQEHAVGGLPAPEIGPRVLRSDSPGLYDHDGAIEKWAKATAPRFVPPTYGPDGTHHPGGIHVPRVSNPVLARDEEAR